MEKEYLREHRVVYFLKETMYLLTVIQRRAAAVVFKEVYDFIWRADMFNI